MTDGELSVQSNGETGVCAGEVRCKFIFILLYNRGAELQVSGGCIGDLIFYFKIIECAGC